MGWSSGRGTEETSLLELELIELLLAVHFDDQRDKQDQEGCPGDPGGFAGATEELLGDESGIAGCLLTTRNDGGGSDLGEDAGVGVGGRSPSGQVNTALLGLGRHGLVQVGRGF